MTDRFNNDEIERLRDEWNEHGPGTFTATRFSYLIDSLFDAVVLRNNALTEINQIRNQIVSSQTVNWSRDIYPLVAALNAAGFELDPGALEDLKARIASVEPEDAPIE